MAEICLALEGVQKKYGDNHALRGVTHTMQGGKIHALIGKNGSGKSTLIKVIAGVTQPTQGGIELDGVRLTSMTPHDALQRSEEHTSELQSLALSRMPSSA